MRGKVVTLELTQIIIILYDNPIIIYIFSSNYISLGRNIIGIEFILTQNAFTVIVAKYITRRYSLVERDS